MTVLERIARTALLGVRPWDAATSRAVTDGLTLTDVRHGVRAVANRSGVFAFHDLSGLRASSFGAGDEGFWASPPAQARIVLELIDERRRYLDFRFDADAPARGLFRESCGGASPPELDVPGVPLFSAPSRIVPGGLAGVRADLWDLHADAPAAWAVLDVTAAPGATAHGVADERGSVLVLLPYPEPPWQTGSPPATAVALSDQTWTVGLAVRYAPGAIGLETDAPPDLCAVLQQPPATALSALSPAVPLTSATLTFGQPLSLATPGHSVLHVTAP
jgi:hypothetical protein